MNGLRVLVTSGGTSEAIDSVRRITNTSTGRLGSLIADAFTAAGAHVTYLCGRGAAQPQRAVEAVREIDSVAALGQALEDLLGAAPYACVVHAMAVSDYTPRRTTTADELAAELHMLLAAEAEMPTPARLGQLVQSALHGQGAAAAGKISSELEDALIVLQRTPKLIGRIKALQPGTVLVGFKLLAGVPPQQLQQVAEGLLARNRCDFVLANDQKGISGDRHEAFLLGPQGVVAHMQTKPEIAEAIAAAVGQKLSEGNA
ncbi:MAG: phosphopantothenoylcysteine decarboxylase [Oscillospiraceae bacterium]